MTNSKESYIAKLEAMLHEVSKNIDELKVQANLGKAEARDKIERQVETLREQQSLVNKKLDEIRGTGEEMWGELKLGMENAIEDMKDGLKRAFDKTK